VIKSVAWKDYKRARNPLSFYVHLKFKQEVTLYEDQNSFQYNECERKYIQASTVTLSIEEELENILTSVIDCNSEQPKLYITYLAEGQTAGETFAAFNLTKEIEKPYSTQTLIYPESRKSSFTDRPEEGSFRPTTLQNSKPRHSSSQASTRTSTQSRHFLTLYPSDRIGPGSLSVLWIGRPQRYSFLKVGVVSPIGNRGFQA